MTRILGIDPGFERLGIAILEKSKNGGEEVIFSTCFKTDKNLKFPDRLKLIGIEVKKVINIHMNGEDKDNLLWPMLMLELWARTWLD